MEKYSLKEKNKKITQQRDDRLKFERYRTVWNNSARGLGGWAYIENEKTKQTIAYIVSTTADLLKGIRLFDNNLKLSGNT